jgi:hypothetical protein
MSQGIRFATSIPRAVDNCEVEMGEVFGPNPHNDCTSLTFYRSGHSCMVATLAGSIFVLLVEMMNPRYLTSC